MEVREGGAAGKSCADAREPIRVRALGEPPLSPQLILRLQTTCGNRVVQQLLERQAVLRPPENCLPAENVEREEPSVSPAPHAGPERWRSFLNLFRKAKRD